MALDKIPFTSRETRLEIRKVAEAAAGIQNMFGAGGASVQSTPGGISIQQAEQTNYVFSFTGVVHDVGPNGQADLTKEVYWVKSQEIIPPQLGGGGSDPKLTDPLKLYDATKLPSGYYWCPVTNLKETTDHSHTLTKGTVVTVYGVAGPGTIWFYMLEGGGSGIFPVALAQDGGGSGGTTTAGTKPTWTYTLKDINTGTTLKKADGTTDATGLSPVASTRLPASAAAATEGTAYRKADGTLVLQQAFEDYAWCTDA